MLKDLVLKNRSYRRFFQERPVGEDTLKSLVDLARLAPSAANLQPLKFILSWESGLNASIFPNLRWAGYLKDWPGPAEGERPSAYIVILGDEAISKRPGCDHGIAAQTILLGAVEAGLGGCIIASIDRAGLKEALSIPDGFEILMAIALGSPKETVAIEPMGAEGDVKYWRDAEGVHHVPKRPLDEVIMAPGGQRSQRE